MRGARDGRSIDYAIIFNWDAYVVDSFNANIEHPDDAYIETITFLL